MSASERGGVVFSRLMVVLSSLAPLFVLWAAQGTQIIRDLYFVPACLTLAALPNLYIWWKFRSAQRNDNLQKITVGTAEDHRTHLLFYLFVVLLPFYGISFSTWRELFTAIGIVCFIVFIFWHLNLHYINLIFELFGYHVFTIQVPEYSNPLDEEGHHVLITKRNRVAGYNQLTAYYLSANVYFETEDLRLNSHQDEQQQTTSS